MEVSKLAKTHYDGGTRGSLRTTVPKKIVEHLGVGYSDYLKWEINGDGEVVLSKTK